MASVRARTLFADHRFTVTALESVDFQTNGSCRRRFVMGSIRPIAVIIKEPHRTYALDMTARPIDIDELELPDDFDLE